MALKIQDQEFTHVIAIDFGTGASGYGISPRQTDINGQQRIEVFNPCDESDDQKTPTFILFDDDGNFMDFGQNALYRYAQMVDDEETALLFQNVFIQLSIKWIFYILIQMQNHQMDENFHYLKLLQKLQSLFHKKLYKNLKNKWVITVPALWSEEHKNFMRKAAKEASLIDHINSGSLILCLEPEGASIQCREDSEENIKNSLKKGTVLLVLDCGGGTVDITVHKLICEPFERFLCEELLPSSGGCEWGSKYVDFYYEEFLEDFLGKDIFGFYKKNSIARLDILKDFEIIKRKFKGSVNERSISKFSYLGDELSTKKLQELIKDYNQKTPSEYHLKLKGSANVELPGALVSSFFRPLFENIKNKVNYILKVQQLIHQVQQKDQKVKFIFLVGGFSENNFLKQEIKNQFEKQMIQILIPRRPQISVIRGACMYGLNPRSITSRIAKYTYGINTLTTFDSKNQRQEKKVTIDGEDFCEDVFDAFVRCGDSISSEEQHTKIYCPVRTKQTFMKIMFYCTEKRDVEYIDEQGVKQLGELCIDIGKPQQQKDQKQTVEQKTVKVSLKFGSTNIYAQAINSDGTMIKNTEFKFDLN